MTQAYWASLTAELVLWAVTAVKWLQSTLQQNAMEHALSGRLELSHVLHRVSGCLLTPVR